MRNQDKSKTGPIFYGLRMPVAARPATRKRTAGRSGDDGKAPRQGTAGKSLPSGAAQFAVRTDFHTNAR
jgi:hypothetical protein